MFPFILSIGILTQGVIFAIAQARGLEGLLILGCQPISQVILPGMPTRLLLPMLSLC